MGWPPLPEGNLVAQSVRWLAGQMIPFNNLLAGVMSIDGVDKLEVNDKRTIFHNVMNLSGLDDATSELTLSSGGGLNPTQSFHRVDTFADASTDNLDNILISGGNLQGDILFLRSITSTRDIVLRETGNILISGADTTFTLGSSGDVAYLVFNGTSWLLVATFGGTLA